MFGKDMYYLDYRLNKNFMIGRYAFSDTLPVTLININTGEQLSMLSKDLLEFIRKRKTVFGAFSIGTNQPRYNKDSYVFIQSIHPMVVDLLRYIKYDGKCRASVGYLKDNDWKKLSMSGHLTSLAKRKDMINNFAAIGYLGTISFIFVPVYIMYKLMKEGVSDVVNLSTFDWKDSRDGARVKDAVVYQYKVTDVAAVNLLISKYRLLATQDDLEYFESIGSKLDSILLLEKIILEGY